MHPNRREPTISRVDGTDRNEDVAAAGAREAVSPRLLGAVLLGLVGVSIFAATPPATRLAVQVFDVWFVTFARAAVATVPAAILLWITRQPIPPRRHWPRIAAISVLATVGYPGMLGLAMELAPATHAGVVLAILPVAMAICAVLVAGERPSARFWALSVAGGVAVGTYTLIDSGGAFGLGDLWLLVAAFCAAMVYALSGALARTMPGWAVISWALLLAFPAMAVLTAVTFRPAYLAAPADAWIAFAYLALFSMFLGFFFWNRAMAIGGVARIGQLQLLSPFVTFAVAAILLGEDVTAKTIAFACLVVVIVFFAQRARVARSD